MALPKKYRLQHRRDFSRVYRAGLRRNGHYLTLRALHIVGQRSLSHRVPAASHQPHHRDISTFIECSDGPLTRAGISISNKVSKRATVRNRIKRQIKAALFQLLPSIPSGWLVVVIVRPTAIECDYWQFLRELEEMLESLR